VINGVRIKASEADARKRLGRPTSAETSFDYCANGVEKVLGYPIGTVRLLEGRLVDFECTDRSCATADGLKVGMPRAQVLQIYGPGQPYQHRDAIGYFAEDLKGCGLMVVFKGDYVESLRIFCVVC